MTAFVILAAIGWLTASIVARYWWHQASYDQLTGLPNRGRLQTRATWARRRRRTTVGLLLLDVDRFKQINDTFGHRAGDELLAAFADRLRQAAHRREVAVRLHGDEFAVWLGAVSPSTAARRADEVAAQLARPVQVAGYDLVMTASVGHAAGHTRTTSLADLLHRADASMYTAKRSRPALPSMPAPAPAARLRDRGKDVA